MSTESKQYVTIDDFSPGIFSAGGWSIYGLRTECGPIPGAPVGSAQELGTFRCVPTEDGRGLQPVADYTTKELAASVLSVASPTNLKITGIIAKPSLGATATDAAVPVVAAGAYKTGVGYHFTLYSAEESYQEFQSVSAGSTFGEPNADNGFFSAALLRMTMNPTTPYLTVGNPVIVYEYDELANNSALHGRFSVIPNPTTPTVKSAVTATAGHYRIFAHQNRLIFVSVLSIDNVNAAGTAMRHFSQINFTDPPNSNVFVAAQNQIFEPTDLSGFGAFAVLNANTLLMIREIIGGVVVQGDIANPVVTNVPAIQGTAGLSCNTAPTPFGMAYGSWENGCHVWAGGAASEKISPQLRDDFFICPTDQASLVKTIPGFQTFTVTMQSGGYMSQFTKWWKYLVASNNWLMDFNTKSWWRLEDPSSYRMQFSDKSRGDQKLWFTNASVGTGGAIPATVSVYRTYDKRTYVSSWSWQSHPIPVSKTEDMANVQEIVLEAQGIAGSTFTLTARGYDGNTSGSTGTVTAPVTVTLPAEAANQPIKIRIPFSMFAYNVIVKIEANDPGGTTAPTLRSIAFGVQEGNLVVDS